MNLVGVTNIKLGYAFNPAAGTVTITITDPTGATVYDTITLETLKHRAFVDSLAAIAEAYLPSNTPGAMEHRVLLNLSQNVATAVFSS